jgi:DNA-binding phage protein
MGKTPIGRSFDEFIEDRIRREPDLGHGLLEEAVLAILNGELPAARNLIRNVIKGSIGYAELSRRTGTPEKSLIRMFGPKGNPTAANLSAVLAQLLRQAGVEVRLTRVHGRRRRAA